MAFPRKLAVVLALALLALPLAACGKKPGHVDPPMGMPSPDPFPRTYPDPATDPQP